MCLFEISFLCIVPPPICILSNISQIQSSGSNINKSREQTSDYQPFHQTIHFGEKIKGAIQELRQRGRGGISWFVIDGSFFSLLFHEKKK